MPGVQGGQKNVSHALEIELQVVVKPSDMDAGN